MSHVLRLWYFSSSVNSFSDPSSTSILHVCEQRRLWLDSAESSLVVYVISTIISWAGSVKCLFGELSDIYLKLIWKIKWLLLWDFVMASKQWAQNKNCGYFKYQPVPTALMMTLSLRACIGIINDIEYLCRTQLCGNQVLFPILCVL